MNIKKYYENILSIKYHLEIYPPNDTSCIVAAYSSNTPFASMSRGDIISAASLNMTDDPKTLIIKDIQHIIWEIENSHIGHKLCIYTDVYTK